MVFFWNELMDERTVVYDTTYAKNGREANALGDKMSSAIISSATIL
jgi:hypothetical protein